MPAPPHRAEGGETGRRCPWPKRRQPQRTSGIGGLELGFAVHRLNDLKFPKIAGSLQLHESSTSRRPETASKGHVELHLGHADAEISTGRERRSPAQNLETLRLGPR